MSASVLQEEQLRSLIREECREAIRGEIHRLLVGAMTGGHVVEPDPRSEWKAHQMAEAIAEARTVEELEELRAAEQARASGARPGIWSAMDLRARELEA